MELINGGFADWSLTMQEQVDWIGLISLRSAARKLLIDREIAVAKSSSCDLDTTSMQPNSVAYAPTDGFDGARRLASSQNESNREGGRSCTRVSFRDGCRFYLASS